MKCENCGCSNPKGCAECCECGAKMGAKASKKKVSAKPKAKRATARRSVNGARASVR